MEETVRFSQNFLRDVNLVDILLDKTNIRPIDTVYDIGAGTGVITQALAPRSGVVVAVEIDDRLAGQLKKTVGAAHNVVVYHADVLSLALPATPYKVFANIPFNVSADIVRKLAHDRNPPTAAYLIVQKEFADKLMSGQSGRSSQMGVLLGARFGVRVVHRLRRSDFVPRPRVATVCVEMLLRPKPLIDHGEMQLFRDFITYVYNAHQPKVSWSLRSIFGAQEWAALAQRWRFAAEATPTQLGAEQWVGVFVATLAKRPALQRLVAGHEAMLEQKHHARVPRRRTYGR